MVSDKQLRALLQIADDKIDWDDDRDVVQWARAIRNTRLLLSVLEDDDVSIHADKLGGVILDMDVDSISEVIVSMKGVVHYPVRIVVLPDNFNIMVKDPANGILFYGSYTAKKFIQEYILK